MRIYFAPLEGLTDAIYRRVHHATFGGVAKYFMPFISPSSSLSFTSRQQSDIDPRENAGVPAVPQILCKDAGLFLEMTKLLRDAGYTEVNLNLGCPSGTVTAKRKGAGFLLLPAELDAFLERVFASPALRGLAISLKTRIGFAGEEEWERLLDIYRQYPLARLIVHPRLRSDYYTGPVHPDAFAAALEGSPFPVVWNGDVFSPADLEALRARFPSVGSVMLGRGLAAEPGLAGRLETGEACRRETLRDFHEAVSEEYRAVLYGETALCHRMKELWSYLILHFEGGEKHFKRLTKAKSWAEFHRASEAVFAELPLLADARMPGLGGYINNIRKG